MISFDNFQPEPPKTVFAIRFSSADPARGQLWHTWDGHGPSCAVAGLFDGLLKLIPDALVRLAKKHGGNFPLTVIELDPACVPDNWNPGFRFMLTKAKVNGDVFKFKIAARRVK